MIAPNVTENPSITAEGMRLVATFTLTHPDRKASWTFSPESGIDVARNYFASVQRVDPGSVRVTLDYAPTT